MKGTKEMKDILTQLFGDAVTEDILKQFNAELGKKFVAKSDYNGKLEDIKKLKSEKQDLEEKINELKANSDNAGEYKKQLETLQNEIKEKEEAEKKAREDAELTSAIEAVFGDKKFTSDYVKNGIIADMKAEISKPENKGKGYAEIFESLTKDKEGIFKNPNPPASMPGMGNIDPSGITREQFAKMGYSARAELYKTNKDLYKELTKQEE